MAEQPQNRPTPLGLYDQPTKGKITAIEVAAILLSILWLGLSGWFFLTVEFPQAENQGANSLQFLMTLMVLFMPVALIWVAATAARSSRVMREESARLQAAIDAIRQAYVAQAQGRDLASEPSVTRKLDEIAEAQRKTETALATFSTSRERDTIRPDPVPAPAGDDAEDQGDLPLGTPAEELGPPLSKGDFIRAMNFPETAEDEEGFAALRKALKDRSASQLIQASQDVLTLLSQDGIYMDDLRPDLSKPEIWRRFAHGERGRQIAKIGGVHDRSSLALTAGRMKQDPIFRDAAHHFLRRFDKIFQEFEQTASDHEISALSETRTARAFMLLGRVSGIFD